MIGKVKWFTDAGDMALSGAVTAQMSLSIGIPGEGRVLRLVGFVLTTRVKTLDIAKLE